MFDGTGGLNGLLPADVCRLTIDQVRWWYAGPMAEMRKAAEVGGGPSPSGPLAGDPAFREFVRKFSVLGVRKTPEGWEAAYRRHTGAPGDG